MDWSIDQWLFIVLVRILKQWYGGTLSLYPLTYKNNLLEQYKRRI